MNIAVKVAKEDLVPLQEDVLELSENAIVSHNYWPRSSQADVDLVLCKLHDKYRKRYDRISLYLLADLKNQPVVLLCVTHILPFCGYFKGQEQFGFNPTSWHLVTYKFL